MGRREIELRDAMAGALAAARVSGGQFRLLVPVYSDRIGLAYRVMRGHKVRRTGRRMALTAIVATVSGAVVAVAAERLLAHREPAAPVDTQDEVPAQSEAAFPP